MNTEDEVLGSTISSSAGVISSSTFASHDPFGTWIADPTYGTVWIPAPNAVGPGFQPYVTNGHWTYGSDGWTWVSDFPWGWVTFHYGRWARINDR